MSPEPPLRGVLADTDTYHSKWPEWGYGRIHSANPNRKVLGLSGYFFKTRTRKVTNRLKPGFFILQLDKKSLFFECFYKGV